MGWVALYTLGDVSRVALYALLQSRHEVQAAIELWLELSHLFTIRRLILSLATKDQCSTCEPQNTQCREERPLPPSAGSCIGEDAASALSGGRAALLEKGSANPEEGPAVDRRCVKRCFKTKPRSLTRPARKPRLARADTRLSRTSGLAS